MKKNIVLLTDGRFTFEADVFASKEDQGGMLLDNQASGRIMGNAGQAVAVLEKNKSGVWQAFSMGENDAGELIAEGDQKMRDGGRIDCLLKLWDWKREHFGFSNWGQGSASTQSS